MLNLIITTGNDDGYYPDAPIIVVALFDESIAEEVSKTVNDIIEDDCEEES